MQSKTEFETNAALATPNNPTAHRSARAGSRRLAAVGMTAAALLALAGCGGGGSSAGASSSPADASPSASTAPSETATQEPTASPSASPSASETKTTTPKPAAPSTKPSAAAPETPAPQPPAAQAPQQTQPAAQAAQAPCQGISNDYGQLTNIDCETAKRTWDTLAVPSTATLKIGVQTPDGVNCFPPDPNSQRPGLRYVCFSVRPEMIGVPTDNFHGGFIIWEKGMYNPSITLTIPHGVGVTPAVQ